MEGSEVISRTSAMYKITNSGSTFTLDNSPWAEYVRHPKTEVTVAYDDMGYSLHFVSYETDLRAVETEHNTAVHKDSCMEFFAQFSPESDAHYINLEMNPNGAAYCAVRTSRYDAAMIDPSDIDRLNVKSWVYDDRWELRCFISVNFIKKFIPSYEHKKGAVIRANFYKCGDETGHEHYGCFNLVKTSSPDFHRPEFFAEFELA